MTNQTCHKFLSPRFTQNECENDGPDVAGGRRREDVSQKIREREATPAVQQKYQDRVSATNQNKLTKQMFCESLRNSVLMYQQISRNTKPRPHPQLPSSIKPLISNAAKMMTMMRPGIMKFIMSQTKVDIQ